MGIEAYLDSEFPTSILHIKPAKEVRGQYDNPLFIWIPGNPGLIEYYEEMLQLLHDRNPEWEILGISHAGMSPDNLKLKKSNRNSNVYSLQDQVLHKVKIINNFTTATRPLIIMGHSVGSYMVQKIVLSSSLVGRVVKVGLLTPTIVDIHTSEKGLMFTRAFRWIKGLPRLAAWGSNLLFNKILPQSFTIPILSLIMGCNRENTAVKTSALLLKNSEFILQALGLAEHEMKIIRNDWNFQKEFLDHCRNEAIDIWLLFSHTDHWVSNETRRKLIHFYKETHGSLNTSVQISSVIPHSFVVEHSKYVVDTYF